ncbi:hypothetical protein BS50DRAFT_630480 [Corynespora cassiicola Philippines]|uniref:Uncharacterized protein n=1 Tax=Corynespora cassiicola Philippines TaxID=1448308 RepID=A0A2T2P450_CORCC|nr:hypothetical protein BS50DRAFT_630480 [Corynespora cassiicola Philippines]
MPKADFSKDPRPNRKNSKRSKLYKRITLLPLELREEIYAHMVSHFPPVIVIRPRHEGGLPSLLTPANIKLDLFPPEFAQTALYGEALAVFFRQRHFSLGRFGGVAMFVHFLKSIYQDDAFRDIRSLSIDYDVPWSPNQSQWASGYVLQRCVLLKSLTIELSSVGMLVCKDARLQFQREPAEVVAQKMCAHTILQLAELSLRELTLLCTSGDIWSPVLDIPEEQMFEPIIEWFKEEINERKLRVSLEIKYLTFDESRQRLPNHVGFSEI